jgi:hypothetical protein
MKSDLLFVAALAASLITFFGARRIFQDQIKLGPPKLLAGAVAALAFLGIVTYGPTALEIAWGILKWLLIALLVLVLIALALFFLVIVALVDGHTRSKGHQSPQKQPTLRALPALSDPAPRRRRSRLVTDPKPEGLRQARKSATGLRGPL